MGIKRYKPTSSARRFMTVSSFEEITCTTPERSLLEDQKHKAGRNAQGKITVRHHGGGNKRKYRIIDFKRNKDGIPAVVKTIEYDPNRTANIALLVYADGEKKYILAPLGLNVGDKVVSGPEAEIQVGNALPLELIPLGTIIHNVELIPGRGGKMVRTAGAGAQLMAKDGNYVTIKMPSSEMRMVRKECLATIGVLGNAEFKNLKVGKAGRTRHLGIRPTVRGVTMNPCDHPHGGGEGKTGPGGNPKTPWGKPALGRKTRKAKKASSKLIVRRRKR